MVTVAVGDSRVTMCVFLLKCHTSVTATCDTLSCLNLLTVLVLHFSREEVSSVTVPQDLGPLRCRDRSASPGAQFQLLLDGLPEGRAELPAVVQQPQQVGLRHLLQRHTAMFPEGHMH